MKRRNLRLKKYLGKEEEVAGKVEMEWELHSWKFNRPGWDGDLVVN
jgi:hypothetical protein